MSETDHGPEAITFRTADGRTARAGAEIVRYGPAARRLRAGLFIAGGIVSGAACILVPVAHLITTWALPALGIYFGIRALRTEAVVVEAAGRCPACGREISFAGGSPGDARTCRHCQAAVELVEDGPG